VELPELKIFLTASALDRSSMPVPSAVEKTASSRLADPGGGIDGKGGTRGRGRVFLVVRQAS
jgi:hypothetical protein